jgi:hypothetical protein
VDAPFSQVFFFFALALAGQENRGSRWAVGDLTIEGVAETARGCGGREPESRDGDARSRRNKEILTSDAGRLEMFECRVPQWNG